MTPDKTPKPTDAEAWAMWTSLPLTGSAIQSQGDFARAVLAKWGSPVVAGEPVASITAEQISRMFRSLDGLDQNQWGTHQAKGWNDALRLCMDYATPQPTQAQAGAVPLPIEIWEVGQQSLQLMFNDHEEAHQYRLRLQGIKEGGK